MLGDLDLDILIPELELAEQANSVHNMFLSCIFRSTCCSIASYPICTRITCVVPLRGLLILCLVQGPTSICGYFWRGRQRLEDRTQS